MLLKTIYLIQSPDEASLFIWKYWTVPCTSHSIILVCKRWAAMKVSGMLGCVVCTEILWLYINVGPSAKLCFPGRRALFCIEIDELSMPRFLSDALPLQFLYVILDAVESLSSSFPCLFQDAKVMSWWDYGYQITAMANRTILVDNNTWNNTHISRVGQVSNGIVWVFGPQGLVGSVSPWGAVWPGILLWEMCTYFSRQWHPQKKKPMRSWGSLMLAMCWSFLEALLGIPLMVMYLILSLAGGHRP